MAESRELGAEPTAFSFGVDANEAIATATVEEGKLYRFEVTVAPGAHSGPLTGRLVIVVTKPVQTGTQPEPRLLINPRGPAMFAIDLQGLASGAIAVVDEKSSLGFPYGLGQLPPGDYLVQAMVNVYEQVHRSDGKSPWLHMNDGTIEFFSNAAGNIYTAEAALRGITKYVKR